MILPLGVKKIKVDEAKFFLAAIFPHTTAGAKDMEIKDYSFHFVLLSEAQQHYQHPFAPRSNSLLHLGRKHAHFLQAHSKDGDCDKTTS